MCQTVSRARKKMSRIVNWSIALLLSRFSPVTVFAPALDFNYLTAVPWPVGSATIREITRNRTNNAASCGFVDRLPCPADLKTGELGHYSRQLFSCFASGRIVYLKTRKSSARPPLPIHLTAITLSALIILFLSVTCLLSFCNGRSFAAKLRD